MKTIVVATDYSKSATNALAYAANMARQVQAQLVLVHAYYMVVTHLDVPVDLPGEKELQEENINKLQPLADQIFQTYGVHVTCMTGPMPVNIFLERIVSHTQADLVVMGMKELSKLDQRLFGSTTASVISEAKFPVLVVPENTPYTAPKKIMIAVDDQESKDHLLAPVISLAHLSQARIQILNVTTDTRSEADKPHLHWFETGLQSVAHEYVLVNQQDTLEGIKEAVTLHKPDVLVMFPHKHDFWDLAFNRSHTQKLAFQTIIPLLALPAIGSSEREYKTD